MLCACVASMPSFQKGAWWRSRAHTPQKHAPAATCMTVLLCVTVPPAQGSIGSDAKGQYTFKVAFGSLKLPAGGLAVDGVPYAKRVDMKGGDVISWGA